MNKLLKYEKLYIKITWLYIALSIGLFMFYYNLGHSIDKENKYLLILFFSIVIVLNTIKGAHLTEWIVKSNVNYFFTKILELAFIAFGGVYLKIGEWTFTFVALMIVAVTFVKGRIGGFAIIISWLCIRFIVQASYSISNDESIFKIIFEQQEIYSIIFKLCIAIMIASLCGVIFREMSLKETENKKLYIELQERYEQLASAQEQVLSRNKQLVDTNKALEDANVMMEESNKRLTASIAEFYTLQEIGRVIGSIFDIQELLGHVNDIIIGVMGVNNSIVLTYNEDKEKFKVNTTNIKEHSDLIIINDNINCEVLFDCLKEKKPIMENFADSDTYPFIKNREVKSLICVPLSTKSRKFGMVIVEHKYFNAFDENNLRLLTVIGQQVGIGMENASLYQQMHEMATIDGLTQVYNRLYFQERLLKEFSDARENNYKLSLAIFDIDHFKKFNDTYGHMFGDKVLKNIAQLVKKSIRSRDIIARFGGEEFVLLFPRTSLEEAFEKVERLRKKIAGITIKDDVVAASVTVSFGVSCYPESSLTENELISRADDALYDAKSAGRNCAKVADYI